MTQCNRCTGRGYLPEKRKPSKRNPNALGFYARTCPACNGTGSEVGATWRYEYTDTFGGEANYSWCKRGTVKARNEASAIRAVKRALDLTGTRCNRANLGETIALYPRGTATVLFIDWEAEA